MAFSKSWDETSPAGSEARSLGDDRIREFKFAIRERLAVDHDFRDDETGITTIGCHNKATLIVQGSDPGSVADAGIIYTKDVDGKAELHWIDEDGDTLQITSGGSFHSRINNPAGMVVMWDGTIASIPSGYNLCDGNNGTKDLRDKFIVGARQDDAGSAKSNLTGVLTVTGGTSPLTGVSGSHVLLATEIPAHTHTFTAYDNAAQNGSSASNTSTIGGSVTVTTSSIGGGGGHTHTTEIPPYYALAFIRKN